MLVNYRLYQVGVSKKKNKTHSSLCFTLATPAIISNKSYARVFTITHMSNQGARFIVTVGMIGMQIAKLSVGMPMTLPEKKYLTAR